MKLLDELGTFSANILNTDGFPPRWHCGTWDSLHGWIHIISDITIGLAYVAIPVMLFAFVVQKKKLFFNYIFVLFSCFILFCGVGHFIEASIFWHPWYRLSALVKFMIAIVSVLTAIELYKIIPEALELKTDKELEEAVERTAKDLSKSARALQRSNEELEEFAYVATHDIQEPVRMINQNIKRLEDHLGRDIDEKTKKYIGFIDDGSVMIQSLTKDLLEYSRLRSELIGFEKVNLNKVLSIVKENLQIKIKETKAKFIVDQMPTVIGIESLLVRLFMNLINNAIKYRDPRHNPKIEITCKFDEETERYVFAVKDNGIGFPQQDADKIFKLFQRLHSKHQYSGSGIGLAACKRVVEYHDGDIWAQSEPAQGSTFFFTLPLHH